MDEIHEFAHLQQLLINQAAKVLRKNGVLVYSTCTIDPLENENVITEFLQSNPEEFTLQDIPEAFQKYAENKILRTFPQRDGMDGSFGAVLKKL